MIDPRSYIIFNVFTCIFIVIYAVYYELTKCPAPRCRDSSVGRAHDPYRRVHGCESHSSLNVFQALISKLLLKVVYITAIINHVIFIFM